MISTTDAMVKGLKIGDRIREFCNGRSVERTIVEVKVVGECVNERSGAFGHAYALIECDFGSRSTVSFSVHSDAYSEGQGYPVADSAGNRIRGFEIVEELGS